jgi:hypothetical protein
MIDPLQAAETNRPAWTQYGVGDRVEVCVNDAWEQGEITELHRLEASYCYRVWLTEKKVRRELDLSEPDDFHGLLRRKIATR